MTLESLIINDGLELRDETIRKEFPELWKYIEDDDVTDFDFNCGNIWLTTVSEIPRIIEDEKLDALYFKRFSTLVGKSARCNFNPIEHTAIMDTETLRITCIHESQSRSGINVCIRKSHGGLRISRKFALEQGYCDEAIMNMLENCVKAKMSFVFCGLPASGKTEGMKLLASTIPKYEKVITIEDVAEIHYPSLNAGASCSELKVVNGNYKTQMETALRMNPQRILFGEIRGREAEDFMECSSNGIPIMATVHTGDSRTITDRILNMLDDKRDSARIVNQLYNDIDVALLLKKKESADGKVKRVIDQVCFYERKNNENLQYLVVENGKLFKDRLPCHMKEKIEDAIAHGLFERG